MNQYRTVIIGVIFLAAVILVYLTHQAQPVAPQHPDLTAPQADPSPSSPTTTQSVPKPLAPGTNRVQIGILTLEIPEGWIAEQPRSSLRVAQYRLEHVMGDKEDAELAVFNQIGGSVEQNLERWYGQFSQPDGSNSAERAQVEVLKVNDLPVTTVYLEGTLIGSAMMTVGEDKPDFALLAAIVETAEGPYYFKIVGPVHTVQFWKDRFEALVHSIKAA
jgi:hypothetical protein